MKEKINQTAGRLKQTVRAVGVGIATLTASFFMSAPAYAAGVQDSQIVKGTEKLVGDVTTCLSSISASGAAWLTRWIRKSGTTALWWRWCPALAPYSVPPP